MNSQPIVVKWVKEDPHKTGHDMAMRVESSPYPEYKVGRRLDFCSLESASKKGYAVTIKPIQR